MGTFVHNITELISFLVALVCYPSIKNSFMKWFLPFLGIIFFCEILTYYLWYVQKQSTISINLLLIIIENFFYGFIFIRITNSYGVKKLISCFIFLSLITYLLSLLYFRGNRDYFFYTTVFSGFFLSAFALNYLYQMFSSQNYIIPFVDPGFWIAFGVSLFFSGASIVFSLSSFILKNDLNLFGVKLYNFIPRILSIILYSSISIAIILCKKKNKTSLLPL